MLDSAHQLPSSNEEIKEDDEGENAAEQEEGKEEEAGDK